VRRSRTLRLRKLDMIIVPAHSDEMYELAHRVRSKRDLERFLDRLAEDYELNRAVWENRSVPDFLSALADCSRRTGETGSGTVPPAGPAFWQYMARLLLGASVVR
jgi:hypothetical protein